MVGKKTLIYWSISGEQRKSCCKIKKKDQKEEWSTQKGHLDTHSVWKFGLCNWKGPQPDQTGLQNTRLLYHFNLFSLGCDLWHVGWIFMSSQLSCDMGHMPNFNQGSNSSAHQFIFKFKKKTFFLWPVVTSGHSQCDQGQLTNFSHRHRACDVLMHLSMVYVSDVTGLAWSLELRWAEPKAAQALTGHQVGLCQLKAQAYIFSGHEPWAQAIACVA